MPILGNGIWGIKVAGNATLLGTFPVNRKNFATNVLTWENKGGNAASRERVSYPSGLSTASFHLPLKGGGMRVTITGRSTLTASITAIANMMATITGSGTIVPPTLFNTRSMQVTITGGGDIILAEIGAIANMKCTIRIGANPSAYDIAQAIWGAIATEYDQTGTMGEKVNSAGAAGDPWTVDVVAGGYSGNQAGKKLKDAADDAFAASVKP